MIGIVAPYGRCEATAAAIRLADLGISLGLTVRLVAVGRHEAGIHSFWDQRVLSGKGDGLYRAVRGCMAVTHFVCDPEVRRQTQLVAEKARQVLVPCWHALRPADVESVALYDHVVCPSKVCCDRLRTLAFAGRRDVDSSKLTWCKWESGLPSVQRDGTVADAVLRVCFLCDAAAIDFSGPLLLQLADDLLGLHQKVEITLLSLKSWARQDRRQIKRLASRWGHRFRHVRLAANLVEQVRELHRHDWVFVAGVRSDFGIHVTRALACGAACIAYDVEPYSELIAPGINGVLVPCEVRTGPSQAPVAVPSFGQSLSSCAEVLADKWTLLRLQQQPWHLDEHRRRFNELWSAVWTA
jgi:glycosyltransferase involved in cell wall biosynthesis